MVNNGGGAEQREGQGAASTRYSGIHSIGTPCSRTHKRKLLWLVDT